MGGELFADNFIHINSQQRYEFSSHEITRALLQSVQIHDGYYDPQPKVLEDNFWDGKYDAGYGESSNCSNINFEIDELIEKI